VLLAEDFYDALTASQMRAQTEERGQRGVVEFRTGGVQPGTGSAAAAAAALAARASMPAPLHGRGGR
jgi:hypothetical protein